MRTLTIIVPCYNEQEAVPLFYREAVSVLEPIGDLSFELLFVDDGSKDGTLDVLRGLAESDRRVKYLSFARNFGKESAMYAGLCNAKGDYVAVMDADLQDPPALLPRMLAILETGEYDSVATRRENRRGEPVVRSWFAHLFYRLINRFSDADIMDGARDFRLMKRDMVEAIVAMGEYNRFSKGIYGWVGFRTCWIAYENVARAAGTSKWSFGKLFLYALDGIVNFSQAPLSVSSWFGLLMTLVALVALVFIVVRRLIWGDPVAGWASTVCVIVFIGGIQLCVLGIIGQYIAKIYLETKKRPHYIIEESNLDAFRKIG